MANRTETRGNWTIERQGRSTYYAVNDELGLEFTVEYKKNLDSTLKEVESNLRENPSAVPPPCRLTAARRRREAQQEWEGKTEAEKLEAVDRLVAGRLQFTVERVESMKNEANKLGAIEYVLTYLSGHRVTDFISAVTYKLALQCDSAEERRTFIQTTKERCWSSLKTGYQPSYTDPWDVAMQYAKYRSELQVYDEFEALLNLYDQCDE